jgi:alanyl-tRNA synthetase
VLDRTPFYAESGGQVGDSGTLRADGIEIPVIDTKKENDLIIHLLEQDPTPLTGALAAVVNQDLRKKTAVHHSATHLLHAALRQVLGAHVAQKGSLVQPGSLRFDFSHFAKMSAEEIAAVERLVNEKIRANIPVIIQEMPKDEALQYGATALFGEKYGDRVRVVTIDPAYSIELCGGTHIGATGELGFFKLTSETAVAAGVRRIEALCGQAAEDHIEEQLNQLQAIKAALKGTKDPLKSLQALADETAKLKKDIERYEQAHLVSLRNELVQKTEQVNGVSFIGAQVQVNGAEALKKLAAELKAGLSVLVTAVDGKSYVAIAISPEITTSRGLDAVQIIKQHVAPLIKGGGGGQKGLATAGGQDISTLHNVIQTVKGLL